MPFVLSIYMSRAFLTLNLNFDTVDSFLSILVVPFINISVSLSLIDYDFSPWLKFEKPNILSDLSMISSEAFSF